MADRGRPSGAAAFGPGCGRLSQPGSLVSLHRSRHVLVRPEGNGGMVDVVGGPTPQDYRENADKIRKLAEEMRFGDSRQQLLDLAERFDRMAARVEERISSSKPEADRSRSRAGRHGPHRPEKD